MGREDPVGLASFSTLDLTHVRTPCWIVDEKLLRRNLAVFDAIMRRTGCRILLALKGFAMHAVFPILREKLYGVCASSPHEARLGREEFGREVHAYAPAYSVDDLQELLTLCDHLVFNSLAQWTRFRPMVTQTSKHVSCGLRINPQHSEAPVALYDPCAPGSRFGVLRKDVRDSDLEGLEGLHFHSLCEQNADALERTLEVVESGWGSLLKAMKWSNFGGGHHITRADYDVERLCRLIERHRDRFDVQVYLEPGEAVGLGTGVLVASVLDVVHNQVDIAILDTSATAHMPDVLEMPYRPEILGAKLPGEHRHTYRLGGLTCLAGDVIGDYSFPEPLKVGDKLIFLDMAHYTMVKTTTFNGIRLPSIALREANGALKIVRDFGYDDYKNRLS